MLTLDSDDGFNIRKNRECALKKETEKASCSLSSMSSTDATPDAILTPVLENSLHCFLLKEDYGISSTHLLNGARKRLLELVQSCLSQLKPVVSRPSELKPVASGVASGVSEHEPVASHTSGHGCVPVLLPPSATGHDPVQSHHSDCPAVSEMMASRGPDTDGDFVYLYDKEKIYIGGAPVPG